MSDPAPVADLLQALEGVIETNERLCTALRQSLDAHPQGRMLSAVVLDDYSNQMICDCNPTLTARTRRHLGAIIGADQPH